MNKALKKLAEVTFEAYKQEQVIHVTSDSQVFLASNYNDAVNHQAYLNRGKAELDQLTTISRKDLAEAPKEEAPVRSLTPDKDWKNPEIVQWLDSKGVEAKVNTKKDDLLLAVANVLAAEADKGQTGGDQE